MRRTFGCDDATIAYRKCVLGKDALPYNQRSQLQAALESELTRLFTLHGLPDALRQGERIGKLPANLTVG